MNQSKQNKEEYKSPLMEVCFTPPGILCSNPTSTGDNEGLGTGDPWNF